MRCKILSIDEANIEEAFHLATEVFVDGSPLHQQLDISLEDYRDYLRASFTDMVSEGLSVASVDAEANTMLGCMICGDYHRQVFGPKSNNRKFGALSAITGELRQHYLNDHPLSPGQVAVVDIGAVAPEVGGLGIYQAMRREVQTRARMAGFQKIAGELSSAATQHVIVSKFGHTVTAQVPIATFSYEGAYPFSRVKEPEAYVLAMGRL